MIKTDKNFIYFALCCFGVCFTASFSDIYNSIILHLFAYAIGFLYIASLLKLQPHCLIPLLGFIFIRITELISGLLIESGGYLTETGVTGEYTGSFIRLIAYYLFFFYCVCSSYSYFSKKINCRVNLHVNISRNFLLVSASFSFIVIILGLLAGLQNGFSLFLAVNRFTFREYGNSAALEFFLNNRFLVIVLLSTIFAVSRKLKIKVLSLVLTTTTLLISILHGEQFTSMVTLLLAFFIAPLLLSVTRGIDVNKRVVKIGGIALVAGTFTVIFVYSSQGLDVVDLVERRVLLQGQLWFVVDMHVNNLFFGNIDSFIRNIPSFFHLNTDLFADPHSPYGMRELMNVFALPNIYDVYIENNVTFTMGQMAMLLWWFGYFGMIPLVAVTAFMFGIVIAYFNYAISKADFISILLSSKLFTWFVFGFQQGEYWYIWGAKTIIFSIFIVFFEKFRDSLGIPLIHSK